MPTVAAARLLPDPPPPAISIGSAGATVSGTFYWDSASTATDDGQTAIKLAAITTGRYIPVSIITSGGGGGLSVASIAALKGIVSSTLTDTQPCTVQTPGSNWVWSASTGAGFESDDNTVVRPSDKGLGVNGRWYNTASAPVVATIAALRNAVSGKQSSISVQSYSTLGDGGGGIFDYDASDTTSSDDGGTIIVAGTKRYKRRYSGAVDVRWFGVKTTGTTFGSPGTDSSTAFQNAIRSTALDTIGRGVELIVPPGDIYFANPVYIDRRVTIRGAGTGVFDSSTRIHAAAGVTAFIIVAGNDSAVPNPNDGGYGSIIEGIQFLMIAKNTNTTTCNFDKDDVNNQITVANASDFSVGQLIRVGGAGGSCFLQRAHATTTSGSNIITNTYSEVYGVGLPGVLVGMWIKPVNFPQPVMVAEIIDTGSPPTARAYRLVNGAGAAVNATGNGTGVAVEYCDDMYARIIAKNGNVLTLDVHFNDMDTNYDNPSTLVYHASCGVYARATCKIRDCMVGNGVDTYELEGCGVFLYGANPDSNVNNWRVDGLFGYNNRHTLKVKGKDSNAGRACDVHSNVTKSWAIVDVSFLGNKYDAPHAIGGAGNYISDTAFNFSVVINPYDEGGTASNVGNNAIVIGGQIAADVGGRTWTSAGLSRITIGGTDGDKFTHIVQSAPMGDRTSSNQAGPNFATKYPYFFNYGFNGGTSNLYWRQYPSDLTQKLYVFQHESGEGGGAKWPLAITDNAGQLGGNPGDLWAPHGVWIGGVEPGGSLTATNSTRASRIFANHIKPAAARRRGAINIYSTPVAGSYTGWVSTASGTPGTFIPFGEIMSHDVLVKSVAGSSNVTLTEIEAAHRVIKLTGALTGNIKLIVKTPKIFVPANGTTEQEDQADSWVKTFYNATSGAFTLTVVADDTVDAGIAITQGQCKSLWSDGTNVRATEG